MKPWTLPLVPFALIVVAGCGDSGEDTSNVPTNTPAASATASAAATTSANTTALVWSEFSDALSGVSLPVPMGVIASESHTDIETRTAGVVEARTVTFLTSDGKPALSLTVVPNPEGLDVETWVRYYPGWPGEASSTVSVAGSTGLLFEEDQTGDDNPTIYFAKGEAVIGIRAALQLRDEKGVLTRADFDLVVEGTAVSE